MNKVFLVGNIGSKYELKQTKSGLSILNFTVATTDSVKGQNGYEKKTDWHKCTAFGKTAENIDKYFDKGKQIIITDAKLSYSRYEKDGKNVDKTDIIVNQFEFGAFDNGGSGGKKSYKKQENTYQEQRQRSNEDNYVEDDIPF